MNTHKTLRGLGIALLGAMALVNAAHAAELSYLENTMLEQKFKSSDSNKDGKLSQAEADAGMPKVAKNFATINSNHDGFVTLAEIKAAIASQATK